MLASHLNAIEKVLLAQSQTAANAGHPNLRGGPREWFLRDFLEANLPSVYEIGQGEIIDENSPPNPPQHAYRNQIDVVIYRRDFPKISYSKGDSAFLVEGVMATIECKTKIDKEGLKEACEVSIKNKSLTRARYVHALGNPPANLFSYVVAYDGPANMQTVADWLPQIKNDLQASAENMIDLIVYLGKGVVWLLNGYGQLPVQNIPQGHEWAYIEQEENNLHLLFRHMMSWFPYFSVPPDLTGYASVNLFQQYFTV